MLLPAICDTGIPWESHIIKIKFLRGHGRNPSLNVLVVVGIHEKVVPTGFLLLVFLAVALVDARAIVTWVAPAQSTRTNTQLGMAALPPARNSGKPTAAATVPEGDAKLLEELVHAREQGLRGRGRGLDAGLPRVHLPPAVGKGWAGKGGGAVQPWYNAGKGVRAKGSATRPHHDAVGQVGGHDEVVLHHEGRLLGVHDEPLDHLERCLVGGGSRAHAGQIYMANEEKKSRSQRGALFERRNCACAGGRFSLRTATGFGCSPPPHLRALALAQVMRCSESR